MLFIKWLYLNNESSVLLYIEGRLSQTFYFQITLFSEITIIYSDLQETRRNIEKL